MLELGGIVLTAVLTTLGTWLVTKYTRRSELTRDARYLAIRVVCSLDSFIDACLPYVYDKGAYRSDGAIDPTESAPILLLPDNVDWRSINPDLMYRVLMLPNKIALADRAISFVAEVIAGPPDCDELFEERALQYSKIGLEALDVCGAMRKAYGMPQRSHVDFNPRESLMKCISDIEKNRSIRNAEQANFFVHSAS